MILITHDIDLAFAFADRITVFYAGTTVETASALDFRKLPQNGFEPIAGGSLVSHGEAGLQ